MRLLGLIFQEGVNHLGRRTLLTHSREFFHTRAHEMKNYLLMLQSRTYVYL